MGVISNIGQTSRQFQYVPTLKAKAGEIDALRNLPAHLKVRIFPIFQMMESVSGRFPVSLASAWAGLPLALDGAHLAGLVGSSTEFTGLFHALHAQGLPVIPVIDFGATGSYHAAVGSVRNSAAPGIVLRVPVHQIPLAASWLSQQNGNPAETDLLIDADHVAAINTGLLHPAVAHALQSNLHHLTTAWRSITLTASAAPRDAGQLVQGPNLIPRRDWQLWTAVSGLLPSLHFGDYGIAHRDLTQPPGVAMVNATVSPRYSLPNDWLIMKGVSTRGQRGIPMTTQYHGHALALSQHPTFGQVAGCWGDARIQQIASAGGIGAAGGRQAWVSIGLNRHVSLVGHQLP